MDILHDLSELAGVKPLSRLQLASPASGAASPLSNSPLALEQLNIPGPGARVTVRTQRVLAPAKCKVLSISADRREWWLALQHGLKMRLFIHSQALLPHAYAQCRVDDVLSAGQLLFTLSPACLQQHAQLTVNLVSKQRDQALYAHSGPVRAGDDSLFTVLTLPSTSLSS